MLALAAVSSLTAVCSAQAIVGRPGRPIVVGLPNSEANEAGEIEVVPNVRPAGAGEAAQARAAAANPAATSTAAAQPAPTPGPRSPFQTVGDWFQRDVSPAPQTADGQPAPAPSRPGPSLSLDFELDFEPTVREIPTEELAPGQAEGPTGQSVEPLFEQVISGASPAYVLREPRWKRLVRGPAAYHCEPGLGRERVIYAPMFIDISQPLNNFRFRLQSAYSSPLPDRAEYFWAKSRANGGKGPPLLERSVDWQEFRVLMETGGPKFSLGTELPFRAVDPEFNPDTAGLSDVNLTTKTVLVDGRTLQLTQIFRSYFNSGLSTRGLGTGHVSMEPGFLMRYQQNPLTYWHGELKFWFPIAGDPNQAGPVLQSGLGLSHVWYDSDSFAILPTFEVQHWTVLSGMQTRFPITVPEAIDGMQIWNLAPGVRLVFDRPGELGLFEVAIGSSFAVSGNRWYDSLLRLDFRFSF